MELIEITILYFLIGLLASVFGSIAGVGGGIIIKPVLDLLGHYDVMVISIMSAATVFSMAGVSLYISLRTGGKVNGKISLFLATGSIIGGFFGKTIFNYIAIKINPLELLTVIQSSLLGVIMIFILYFVNKKNKRTYDMTQKSVVLITGFILGVLASFLGIGGGPLNVAVLMLFYSMGVKESALNSIFIIFFSQLSSLLVIGYTADFSEFNFSVLGLIVFGGIIGGFIGSRLSGRLKENYVQKIFNIGIGALVILNFFNAIRYLSFI